MLKRLFLPAAAMTLLVGASLHLQAQCPPQGGGQNEIGVRLASVTNQSNIAGFYDGNRTLAPSFLNGIHYKRYGEAAAFRAAFYRDHLHYDSEGSPVSMLQPVSRISDDEMADAYHFKLGAEYFVIMGMVEPYIGADVHVARGLYSSRNYTATPTGMFLDYDEKWTRTAYGISPALGIRVFAGYGISFSAETTLDLMAHNSRYSRVSYIDGNSQPDLTTSGFITQWQPINWLGVNVLF